MKPTKKQQKAIETARIEIGSWFNSNQLSSPTNPIDVEETCRNLIIFDDFTEAEAKELEDKILDLYYFILNLK